MKRLLVGLAAVIALGSGIAVSQSSFPTTLPPSTVVGRLGVSSGPAQAIPFGTLFGNLFNGGSAPAAHSVLLGEGSNALGTATIGTAGRVLVDKGASADPAFTVISGDATLGSTGTFTIAAAAVTNAKMALMAANSVKCNSTGSIGSVADCTIALAADFRAGTTNKILDANSVFTAETTTTYGSTTTFDFSTFINTKVTLTGNISTVTLSNMKAGQSGVIRFIQDGTGNRTIPTTINSNLKCAGGCSYTLSTAASAVDVLPYACIATNYCVGGTLLKAVQ